MAKRLKYTAKQYESFVESRDWCARHGWTGLQEWYNEMLAFEGRRGALPHGAPEGRRDDDERDNRRSR